MVGSSIRGVSPEHGLGVGPIPQDLNPEAKADPSLASVLGQDHLSGWAGPYHMIARAPILCFHECIKLSSQTCRCSVDAEKWHRVVPPHPHPEV